MLFTDYAEDKILRTFLGETAVAPPAMYVALFLSNPGESGIGTEISYPGYARPAITFSPPVIGETDASIASAADVVFSKSTISTSDVTHFGLFDSQLNGRMWAYMPLDEPIHIAFGVAPIILAGEWNYISSGMFSPAMKSRMLNLFRGIDLPGFTPHIGLWDGNPQTGGAELQGAGYGRFAVQFAPPTAQPAGQSRIAINAFANSPRALVNWGTWAYTVICTALTGGEMVAFAEREPHLIMNQNRAAFVEPGSLTVDLN